MSVKATKNKLKINKFQTREESDKQNGGEGTKQEFSKYAEKIFPVLYYMRFLKLLENLYDDEDPEKKLFTDAYSLNIKIFENMVKDELDANQVNDIVDTEDNIVKYYDIVSALSSSRGNMMSKSYLNKKMALMIFNQFVQDHNNK